MKNIKRELSLCFVLLIIFTGALAVAHKGKIHKAPDVSKTKAEKTTLQSINEKYVVEIKPIFQKSCFDCHTSQTNYPWYYKIPTAKALIDRDIKEAKEHLDMENGFPFESHATPEEDLNAILSSIESGEMPPPRYTFLHSDSKLTLDEIRRVRDWVQYSHGLLKSKK